MSDLSDKQLDEILENFDHGQTKHAAKVDLLAWHNAAKNQLLTEIMEQQFILPVTCTHDALECHCKRYYAIPVTVIQKYLNKENI